MKHSIHTATYLHFKARLKHAQDCYKTNTADIIDLTDKGDVIYWNITSMEIISYTPSLDSLH